MKFYVLKQDLSVSTKRATAMHLIRYLLQKRQRGRYIYVKGIWDSLTESFVNDKIIEMTENEFVHAIINHIGRAPSKRQGNVPMLHVVHGYSCFEWRFFCVVFIF